MTGRNQQPDSTVTSKQAPGHTMPRVGFIGLGDQGGGIARRLLNCDVPTTLWARRDASLEPFRDTDASFAATPAALAARSDVVGICVVDDTGVEEVVLGDNGVLSGMATGGVIALHSTISLAMCRRVSDAATAVGVGVIDAPVSGGGGAATQGKLTVLVGGADDMVHRACPVLHTFAGSLFHLGPLGSGLLAKLVNNTLHAAHYALADEALNAGAQLGLDRSVLGQALAVSSGGSFSLSVAATMDSLDALAPFVGPLLHKDVGIFDGLISEHDLAAPTLIAAADEALNRLGHPRADAAATTSTQE